VATFHEIRTPDDRDPPEPGPIPPGVRGAALVFVGLAVVLAVPYVAASALGDVAPDAEAEEGFLGRVADLRPWLPGDPAPFGHHFRTDGAGPAVAEAGAQARFPAAEPIPAHTLLADREDALAVISLTPEEAPGEEAAVEPGDDALAGEAEVAAAPPPPPPDPFARIVIPETVWEGITAEIEDPHGAMESFYRSLAHTALKKEGAITRITQWGDSAIAADGMTSAARQLLQRQFGDAGHGFALVAAGNPWYRRKDVVWSQTGWRTQEFIRRQAPDGRYGYGGVGVTGYLGANATWSTVEEGPVGTRAGVFEVYYHEAPRHGRLAVLVDGEEHAVIDTAAEEAGDAFFRVEVEDGPHEFRIRNVGGGLTRVYGVVIERQVPGVVYDGIGVVGARAARQLNADAEHMAAQIAHRAPDLMLLSYGGNAVSDSTPMTTYADTYRQVLRRFRDAAPDAACVAMSPLDHGERHRGRIRTVPRQYDIMETQREVALEVGCAWYSIFDAMGGEGSIGRWFQASPALAASDLAHPTARGSEVLGALWYKAIMKGFAEWLDARRARPAAP